MGKPIIKKTVGARPINRHAATSANKKKVLIALSGGIDSAVSAYLLIKQGYEVEAAFMKNWSSTKGLISNECPWLQDRQDALRVAAFLRIPLHTLDFEKQYQTTVMEYFFDEYKKGRTPNPDVMCNKEIKFKLLYNWAMEKGFACLATGHYARIAKSNKQEAISKKDARLKFMVYSLQRSVDEFKDQTYFIYNIKPEQLPHLMFPVGGMKKAEVKSIAKKIGLPNAGKKESMGLCFVGKIRLKDFLQQKLREKTGNIIDQGQNIIGQHQGLHNYTIGQRQGIRVGAAGPYYVTKKDLKSNTLFVTNDPEDECLKTKEVQIHSVNLINPNFQFSPLRSSLRVKLRRAKQGFAEQGQAISNFQLTGRYRHQGELIPLTIKQIDNDHYQVIFKKPQKAVASSQSLVLYKGKECVGGGIVV